MSVTHQQAKDTYGGIKVGSAFLGFVTSIGMVVLLVAVLAATGLGLGGLGGPGPLSEGTGEVVEPTDVETDWYLGVTGVVLVLVVLFVAHLAGGYVAGRMARFHGVRQGVAVWLWAVLVTVVLGVLAATLGADEATQGGVELSPLAPGSGELGTGAVGLAVVAVVTLVGAVLGGLAGMRFHRRVDRAEAEPPAASDVSRGPVV